MYVDNLYKPIKYQSHGSNIKVTGLFLDFSPLRDKSKKVSSITEKVTDGFARNIQRKLPLAKCRQT